MQKETWEEIITPERPIVMDELEIKAVKIEPSDLHSKAMAAGRPEIYQDILRYWDQKQGEMAVTRAKDFKEAADLAVAGNGQKLQRMQSQVGGFSAKIRLNNARIVDGVLRVSISGTNYAEFIGTNERAITDSVFRENLMKAGLEDHLDEQAYFSNALAACAVIYGAENGEINNPDKVYVPVGWRSDKVMIYPGVPHVFGGVVKDLNIGVNTKKELRDEIGLKDHEMGTMMFYGIIRQGLSS